MLGSLGNVACAQGSYGRATALLKEALALFQELSEAISRVSRIAGDLWPE